MLQQVLMRTRQLWVSFMNDPTEEAVDTEDMDTEGDDAEEVADEAGENSGIFAESE